MKVCIAYPLAFPDGKVYQAFLISLLALIGQEHYIDFDDLQIAQSPCWRFPIDANRNEHVRGIIAQLKPDYILFLDADMTHPADTLVKLLAHNKDIVGGLYHYGAHPFPPVALVRNSDDSMRYTAITLYDDALFRVDATGMGCVLIKREVFENVEFPWFLYEEDPDKGIRSISEDMHFFKKVRAEGYEVWIDPTVKCGHIKTVEITEQNFLPYQRGKIAHLERLRETDPKAYEIEMSKIPDMRGNREEAVTNG